MEKISIRRNNYADLSFNPHSYKKIVKLILPQLCDIEANEIVKYISIFYNKLAEFDTRSEENLLKRSIAKQQMTYAIIDENGNPKDAIQTDTIVLGKNRNWPTQTDVVIKGFENKDFHFTNLDSIIDLLSSHQAAYIYTKSFIPKEPEIDFITLEQTVAKHNNIIDVDFDLGKLSPIFNIIYETHGVKVDTKDYVKMMAQLKSVDMSDAVYYALHGEKEKLAQMLVVKLDQTSIDIMQKNSSYNNMLIYSEFNMIKKIIEQELDNPGKYLDLIKKNKIKTALQFYGMISQKEKDKIMKIVGDRNKKIYAKPCSHNDPHDEYMSYFKVTATWAVEKRKKSLDALMSFLSHDEKTKQYYCNSCGERVICEHTLEFAGTQHKEKISLVEKYREPEDSSKKYSYCKYCNEQIFRNELEEIMTSVKFEEIVRSRQQTLEGDTHASAFENGLYFGVSNAISALKIDYEYPQRTLVKTIMNIVYNMVYSQVGKLKAENDLEYYEQLAGMYGYLYTAIYMMSLFISDPKVNTLDKSPKDKDSYARYFSQKVSQRFHGLASPDNTKRIMYQAYLDLKTLAGPTIMARNESDKILEILQNPLFLILYRMHLCNNVNDSPIDAYKKIVTQPKPNVTTFFVDAKVPIKNVSERTMNLYTYLMDYKSPYCYVFQLDTRPTGAADVTYDPKIYNLLIEEDKQIKKQQFIRTYVKLYKSGSIDIFSKVFGANFIYDDEGDMIDWSNGMQWTTKSGKVIKLSDIKKHVDETTDEKIKKRNQKIKFVEQKFKHKALPKNSFVKLDNPPNYTQDKKLLGIVTKVSNKYSPNTLEYLGRSIGYNYIDLIRGVIPGIENYIIGYCKVKYYCQLFIERYYSLKYEPLGEANSSIIEESKIEFNQIDAETNKLTDLPYEDYYKNSSSYVNLLEPKLFYEWCVETFAKFIIHAEKTCSLGKIFVDSFMKFMVNTEKKLSLPNPKKLVGGVIVNRDEDTEYDEAEDARGEVGVMDDVDFEQDEDDINDD